MDTVTMVMEGSGPFKEPNLLNSGKVTRQGTWLEVSHYWQVMIDEAQIDMKECHTYLHCTQVTH